MRGAGGAAGVTYWHKPDGTMQELVVGGTLSIGGEDRTITSVGVRIATAAEAVEMGCEVGDMVTIVAVADVSHRGSHGSKPLHTTEPD
jgi:hypothetical protein